MNAFLKRAFDLILSTAGLILLSPVFTLIALAIRLSGPGPVFYRQERAGQYGRPFRIWKFRSMLVGADRMGPGITQAGDHRVTRIGAFLRRTKLDELPQLMNVLAGDMSLVGPRPELPRYVALYTPQQREILRYKPGITDLASMRFRDEEALLSQTADLEHFYLRYCVPKKIELNSQYARRANVLRDCGIIMQTLWLLGFKRTDKSARNRPPHPGPQKGRSLSPL